MKIQNTGIPVLTGCEYCKEQEATLWDVFLDNGDALTRVAACSNEHAVRYFGLLSIVIKGVEFPPQNYVEHLKSEV